MVVETRAGPVVLDGRKVMYLPGHKALLLGDIHFEKASFLQAAGGHPLPALDTHDNLVRLERLVREYKPKRVIALGDSFHDIHADKRLSASARDRINALETEIVWVLGNHDPDIPAGVQGLREDHMELGKFLLTHHPHDATRVVGEAGVNVCGHLHPKARVAARGRTVTGPCFAVCEGRIVVPSFGAFTGGLYVNSADFRREIAAEDGARACRYYVTLRGHIAPVPTCRVA